MSYAEYLASFVFTWMVILLPPLALRILGRKPWNKGPAIVMCALLWFSNLMLFIYLGSQSKSHLVLLIGAFAAYKVLTYQTRNGAAKAEAARRRLMGYDG